MSQPVVELVPETPAVLGPPWWRTRSLFFWLLAVVGLSALSITACWRLAWSHPALSICGLCLDALGVALVAFPFARHAYYRVRVDPVLRQARANLIAFEHDIEIRDAQFRELDRQIASGVAEPRVQVPDTDGRNEVAEYLADSMNYWQRRSAVPEREAAGFILGGTSIAFVGFIFQVFASSSGS